jgi:enamine deaminase RidA (YjgF/YER057c/UK114 family)
LLEILIFLADLNDAAALNELWDEWVPEQAPPIRACVQAGLATGCHVEALVSAAIAPSK